MATTLYKHFVRLTLAVFLTGCASDSETYRQDSSMIEMPQEVISPANEDAVEPSPYSVRRNPPAFYNAAQLTGTYTHSPALRNFIAQMVHKHGFSENYLNGLFSQANRLEEVIHLESPEPSTAPTKPKRGSWTRYRNKFLTEAHISNGTAFWRANALAIAKASATYKVDPEYIVGIIGVETYFGKNIGKTSTFDALTTLSFDTRRRAKYFSEELEHFLLMSREEGYDPREPIGSWAGAMGLGQFMPSSFRRLAVDFDQNGHRDLWQPQDAIGSVAHYFSRSGWKFKEPVTEQEEARENDPTVIELSTYSGSEFWHTHHNFKVIKRYNNSNKYAMAVHQLAQAIKQKYREG